MFFFDAKKNQAKSGGSHKKGLDNSDNNTKINNNDKEGDNDGRQRQNKRDAFAKISNYRGGNGERAFIRRGSVWGLNEECKKILSEANIPTFNVRQLKKGSLQSAQQFSNTIKNIKKELGDKGSSVSVYSDTDYKDMDLFLSEDGQSGIAIKSDGDIVSVFAGKNAPRGSGYTLMLLAIQNGGKKLDCFDVYLPKYYSQIGFKAVARTKWSEEYKPEDWNKDTFKYYNNGEPDVVYMVYDAEHKSDYKAGDGKLVNTYEEAVEEQGNNTL